MIKQQAKKTQKQKQTASQNSHKVTKNSSDNELTFLEHIYELRSRLFWVVTALVVTSSVGYYYKDYLVDFIMAPLNGEKLIYLTPGGGFSFIFTVCLYFGALLTIPVIVYHIYRFLQPVLGKTSRRFIALLVLLSGFLAASGAVFGYAVAIPGAINFLTTFAGDAVTPNLTAESYLGFVVAYMLGLAALFQLPLLLFMFDHVKPFPPGALLSSQRFVIVGAFIAAAIITPTPDIVNQLIVAAPIIVIYQLGAVAVFIRRQLRQHSNKNTVVQSADSHAGPELVKHSSVPVNTVVSTSVVSAAVTPLPAQGHAQTTPGAMRKRSNMDGFSRTSRPSVAVPNRTAALARQQVSTVRSKALQGGVDTGTPRRPLRSTDGFIRAS